jgi:twitching motility protein PilI
MSVSAQQSLALLERDYKANAVHPSVSVDERMVWVGTSLGIAGVPLLIGEGELQELIETPSVMPIPGTKPWVMGVASHAGGLLPIISGDVLFRREPYTGRSRDYCMVLRRPGFYFGITLSAVERDMKFPLEQRDMEQPIDVDFARFALGGFHDGDRFLAVLDIDQLVEDDELSNAAATEPDPSEEMTNE